MYQIPHWWGERIHIQCFFYRCRQHRSYQRMSQPMKAFCSVMGGGDKRYTLCIAHTKIKVTRAGVQRNVGDDAPVSTL